MDTVPLEGMVLCLHCIWNTHGFMPFGTHHSFAMQHTIEKICSDSRFLSKPFHKVVKVVNVKLKVGEVVLKLQSVKLYWEHEHHLENDTLGEHLHYIHHTRDHTRNSSRYMYCRRILNLNYEYILMIKNTLDTWRRDIAQLQANQLPEGNSMCKNCYKCHSHQ